VLTYAEKDGFRPFLNFPALFKPATATLGWFPIKTMLHRRS
jgi:hypothetical protein